MELLEALERQLSRMLEVPVVFSIRHLQRTEAAKVYSISSHLAITCSVPMLVRTHSKAPLGQEDLALVLALLVSHR